MNLQDTLQTLRQKAFPRTHALESELSVLQAEHVRVAAEMEGVRAELAQTRENDTQQLTSLQQQLASMDAERNAAGEQVQSLEATLAKAVARQQDAEQHLQALELKHQAAIQQVQSLETSLTGAATRQQESEQNFRLLETQLVDMRSQYETSLGLTQETLLRLQAEQQSLSALQSDQAKSFHKVGSQLLESVQANAAQPRVSMLQVALISGLLFLSGAVVSSLLMRDDNHDVMDLTVMEGGIRNLQQLTKIHFASHDDMLKILTQAMDRNMELLKRPIERSAVIQQQADPDLQQPATDPTAAAPVDLEMSPLTDRLLANLQVLGFSPGLEGHQALADFSALYLPVTQGQSGPSRVEIEAELVHYADLARVDEDKFELDEEVLAAIRLASVRTGVEFPFLMELAEVESDFNPSARAPGSDATGLYQFREDSWLDAVHAFGDKYGLDEYANQVEYVVDKQGVAQPAINDAALRESVLELRNNPRFSALLAAEYVKKNRQQLATTLARQPGRTELYLMHFFGTTGAVSFLNALADNPAQIARELFPGQAQRNRYVFQDKARKPRSVNDIYKLFEGKFNTSRYEEG